MQYVYTIKILHYARFCIATSYLVKEQKECLWRVAHLAVFSLELATMDILPCNSTIYKAPPTAQGQWVSAYYNRKDFIYEESLNYLVVGDVKNDCMIPEVCFM